MIILFITSLLLCSAIVLGQLIYPFYRHQTANSIKTTNPLTDWYQTQVQELDFQRHNHEISQELYQQNLVALQRELLLSQSPSQPWAVMQTLPSYGWALVALLCTGLSLGFYWQQGSASDLIQHYQTQNANQQAEHYLQTIGGVPQLQNALRQRLQHNPNDAHGWYLLGRLALHDNQWQEAIEAFDRANGLQPNQPNTLLSLAEALYLSHQPQAAQRAKTVLQPLLQRDPSNPGALNLLALFAYQEQHYQRAIDLWQALLNQAPAGSDTASALQKAIGQARDAMQNSSSSPPG
jgi:cytochrome c-type biogenesis protein CcmH